MTRSLFRHARSSAGRTMRLRQQWSLGTCVESGWTWASPVSANEQEAAPTAPIVTACAAASLPPCRGAGWWVSSGEAAPRPVWMKKEPHPFYAPRSTKDEHPAPCGCKGYRHPRGKKMTNAVAVHEAGHVLVGLKTGRKLLRVWVRGGEGCVDFEAFRWFPGGVARIRRGLGVDVAGFLAEDLAAGRDRDRLSRRLAGGHSGPIQIDDRAAVRKAW